MRTFPSNRQVVLSRTTIALLLILFIAHRTTATDQKQEYRTRNGNSVVVRSISTAGTEESAFEFYSEQKLICTLDYTSEDHEHGFGVVKAAWTPDQNYFVFSLTSSGGHQPWHAPTTFFSVRDSKVDDLDAYVVAVGISKADFVLRAPNVVATEVLGGEANPVSFRLDLLTRKGNVRAHPILCSNGKIIKAAS